jgi:hypothetical protein
MPIYALESRTPALLEMPTGFFVQLPGITPDDIRSLAFSWQRKAGFTPAFRGVLSAIELISL